MRITIEHSERETSQGWLRKKKQTWYDVQLTILLTETERAILDRRKLWDHTMFEIPHPALQDPWVQKHPDLGPLEPTVKFTIKRFCATNGMVRSFSSVGEAKNFDGELRTTFLPQLKEIIDFNEKPGANDTFEL